MPWHLRRVEIELIQFGLELAVEEYVDRFGQVQPVTVGVLQLHHGIRHLVLELVDQIDERHVRIARHRFCHLIVLDVPAGCAFAAILRDRRSIGRGAKEKTSA